MNPERVRIQRQGLSRDNPGRGGLLKSCAAQPCEEGEGTSLGESSVTTETTGMQPLAKGCKQPPETGQGKRGSALHPHPADTLGVDVMILTVDCFPQEL